MQSVRAASSLPATQADAQPHIRPVGSTPARLKRYFPSLTAGLCRLSAIFGSLREHIRIQFSTEAVDLGPSFSLHDGNWIPNIRTTARAEGIEKLRAIHPMADIADIQTFLVLQL